MRKIILILILLFLCNLCVASEQNENISYKPSYSVTIQTYITGFNDTNYSTTLDGFYDEKLIEKEYGENYER